MATRRLWFTERWFPFLILGVAAVGTALPDRTAPVPEPSVVEITSSSIRLEWPRVVDATEMHVVVGPEPPDDRNGPLPHGYRIATLGGGTRSYTIEGIAPGVQAFVRVEAVKPDGVAGRTLHVKVPGGPGVELDGPVRAVQGFAPHILRVVVAEGEPDRLQAGPWRVTRRDGSPIPVQAVHRHSVPVSQPTYEVEFEGDQDLSDVRVDHRLYLVLGEPIGRAEVLRIRGPGVALTTPFSDRYMETPVVQLNQVGYHPAARTRYAYVSGWMGDGGGLDLEALPASVEVLRMPDDPMQPPQPVRVEALGVRSRFDGDAGAPVAQINLIDVPSDDKAVYRLRIPGVGVSWPTRVSSAAAWQAFRTGARGLYHNRWGAALESEHTRWPRPRSHGRVFTGEQANAFDFHDRHTPKRQARTLRGGYHDAADFDQRPMHTVVPQLLMRAYEIAPKRFTDDQLDIPESGNGIPDLLDEALWGVAAWEQLQESHGGVRAGVESWRHPPGIYPAHEDRLPYWTYAPDADVTARAAGVFAQAARLLRPYEPSRSRELARRARRAWQWASQHGARDEYALYPLGELARLTGQQSYATEFRKRWTEIGPYGAFSNFAKRHNHTRDYVDGGQVMPDYILGFLQSSAAPPDLHAKAVRWLERAADETSHAILDSPHAHRNGRGPLPPDWGQGTVMGRYLDPIFARMSLGDVPEHKRQTYFDAVSVAADYVLGANPLGMVFLTGLGERSPQEPLHLDSLAWRARGREPVPGIPVYGPVRELPTTGYYRQARAAFFPPFDKHPLMLRYGDVRSFVNTNECTVWECQAPHTEHFAILWSAAP